LELGNNAGFQDSELKFFFDLKCGTNPMANVNTPEKLLRRKKDPQSKES